VAAEHQPALPPAADELRADPLQLGGDVVLGPDVRLRYVHVGRDPTDRPGVEALLAALDREHSG